MAKLPTTLGQLNTPTSNRSIAGYDVSSIGAAQSNAASAMNRGLQSLAGGFQAVAGEVDRLQQIDNRRYASDLDNEYAKAISLLQYGDGTDQNPGYFNMKGQAALDQYQPTQKKLEDLKQQIAKKAQNRTVKDTFLLAANSRQTTESEQMTKWSSEQRNVAANTTSKVRVQQARDDIAAAPGNDEIRARSLAISENEVMAQAKREGWSPEITNQALKENRSAIYVAEITSAVVTDPEAADAIYQKHKGEIVGGARADIEKVLLEQTLDAQGQAIAEEAQAKGGKTLSSQLAYIREKYSGKKEEKAVAELKERYSEIDYQNDRAYQSIERANAQLRMQWAQQEHDDKVASDNAQKSAWAAVTGDNPIGLTKWAAANPTDFNHLDAYTWGKLQNAETAFLEGKEYGDITDPKYLQDLHKMNAGDLANTDLYLNKKKFKNEADYKQALALQQAARDRINEQSNNASTYRRMEYMFRDYAPKDSDGKIAVKDETMNAAENEGAMAVNQYVQQYGKAPDDQFLRDLANRLMAPIYKNRNWWTDKRLGVVGTMKNLPVDDQNEAYVPVDKIDQVTLKNIYSDLAAAGLMKKNRSGQDEPTIDEVTIGKLAVAALQGNTARYKALLADAGAK